MNSCSKCGGVDNDCYCPGHISYWGINPLPDSVAIPAQTAWASLYAEISRLNLLLNERCKEIERLRGEIGLLQQEAHIRRNFCDNLFVELEAERNAVVAHLRERAIHGAGNTITVEDACTILADLFERGEHRQEGGI